MSAFERKPTRRSDGRRRLVLALALAAGGCRSGNEDAIEQLRATQRRLEHQVAALETKVAELSTALRPMPARAHAQTEPVAIDTTGAPALGGSRARAEMVIYGDLQSPYSARALALIRALHAKYGDALRIAFKHFPLSRHAAARPLAEASLAVHEQGRFWEFVDVVMRHQTALSADRAGDYAREAGAEAERFARDLSDHRERYRKLVDADISSGQRAGVSAAPSLFLNGLPLRQWTLEAVSQQIDHVLTTGRPPTP